MRITQPTDLRDRVPAVITREGLFAALPGLRMTSTFGSNIPPAHVGCAECGQRWSIDDCFGIVVKTDTQTISLADYVGQPLSAVRLAFLEKADAHYMLGRDLILRNAKYHDDRPDPDYPSLKMNDGGWMRGKAYRHEPAVTDDHIVEPGDEGFFHIWRYLHPKCNEKHQEKVYVAHYQEILGGAEIEGPVTLIPNGYCPCDQCGPWITVQTKWGLIEMGWRKRVINIDWSGTGFDGTSEFNDEQVTRGATYIHAWGKAKAVEYLKRLQRAMTT